MLGWTSKWHSILSIFHTCIHRKRLVHLNIVGQVINSLVLVCLISHRVYCMLTRPMLRLLSSKDKDAKIFLKPSKPSYVCIHGIALAEYSPMSTHETGFQSFLRFFASFCFDQTSNQRHKGLVFIKHHWIPPDVNWSSFCLYYVFSIETRYLRDKCSMVLHRYYEAKNHQKKQISSGG